MDNSQVADQVLDRYLAAHGPGESEELGTLLISCAAPIIRKVVFWRISESRADAEDVCGEAILNLTQRLQRYKEEKNLPAIEDFSNYAAATAHHACDRFLRRKNPSVWRLRNRIRYVLEHHAEFSLWRNRQGAWLCGLAVWRDQGQAGEIPPLGEFASWRHPSLHGFISRVFRISSVPLQLSDVVELARKVMNVPSTSGEFPDDLDLADNKIAADLEWENRRYAVEMWKEIQDLPPRQRFALLVNLKNDAMDLLLLTGVTSFRQIAAVLELRFEQLASLWNRLPLEDAEIAQMLVCTRQQVINLRMAARKRLANRLAGWR